MAQVKAKLIIHTDDNLLSTQTFNNLTDFYSYMKICVDGINTPETPDELNVDIGMRGE